MLRTVCSTKNKKKHMTTPFKVGKCPSESLALTNKVSCCSLLVRHA